MASFQSSSSMVPMILVFLTTLLFVNKVVNSASDSSFTFPDFKPEQPNLIFQGDAFIGPYLRHLQLNRFQQGSLGRALYSGPIQIWERRTGKVASFTTSFAFTILNQYNTTTADGLTFFLAHADIPLHQAGGLLGLFPDENTNGANQVVAVEFDTYRNSWDPEGRHIGIDVNGIRSVVTTPWDFYHGRIANVEITYEASTKVLTTTLVYPFNQRRYTVSSIVDIKNVLPEFVRVGFSGASGAYTESHNILSWTFDSRFPSSAAAGPEGDDDGAFNNVNGLHSSV